MSRKLLGKKRRKKTTEQTELPDLKIEQLSPEELEFKPIEVEMPPVPMLAHGLDRVLFNPGVYRLQDPRSRIYNFDPYLEKIMPVAEFDFDALSAYKTSSKDESLLAMTKNLGMKFTGSTSSMSGALTHFHYLLSNWRKLRQDHLSQQFPDPSDNFSRIQRSPAGIFLRWKDGVYAIDADKQYDKTNIMSWLGHTLEKLLTNPADTFERYRRSSPEKTPYQGEERKSYHYSQLGRVLMRSQLDAYDPRLPGSGVFDLKTRAVVSIRMDHEEYEKGSGYQLRFGQGEWESFEREYYDMTRATMLKYSLQVRMGRMDGIFVAYHNVERIFGFQYISLSEMDQILHGQSDTCLGDQEFKLSIHLLTEMLERATQKFPNKSIRLHFDTRETQIPFMYIFAEAVSEEEAEVIQNTNAAQMKEFERSIIGLNRDDPDMQAEWQEIQERVYEEVVEDQLQERDESEDEGIGSQDEDMILGQRQAGGEAIDTGGSLSRVNPSHKATVEERSGEANTPTPSKPEMVPDVDRASNPSEDVDGTFTDKQGSPGEPISNNPGNVMGWTLTIRNRVNGQYVPRPESLGPFDSWSIEYYIQELEPNSGMQLYQALKQRRAKAHAPKEGDSSMKTFRQIIHSFSKKGRQWRERQDKIDEQIGKRMYRPLGPGSANVIPDEGPWVSEKAMSDIGNNGSCGADK
ncbi:Pet127-domain-containing protein [Zopfia rhizophila CBS 207.26]|uniref:Pet127-domain-containing protein n=1 Tax=Zopfia rhizophila CBS 207.26 TaxID=1314779 RepID=A0A6A6DUK4_9PEZI|nr:Pet127-domain-containing protein [Zopfia rhizophila CBS 207.26]